MLPVAQGRLDQRQVEQVALRMAAAEAMGVVPDRAALAKLSDEEIIERCTEVRGVGRWTVEMMLIFHLGRPDVLPVDDLGVRKGAMRVYGLRKLPDAKRLEKLSEAWHPWRSVGSWYMWRATELPEDTWRRARTGSEPR